MFTTLEQPHPEPAPGASGWAFLFRWWVRSWKKVLAAALLIYFFIWPFLLLCVGAVRSSPYGKNAEWTLSGVSTVLGDPRNATAFAGSVAYSAGVMVLACILGIWFAAVSARMRTRMTWVLTPIMVMVVATPRLFFAIAWGMLGNPRNGMISNALREMGLDVIAVHVSVYSWEGLIGVTALKATALTYLLLLGPMHRYDRSLEDAAVMCGVSRIRAFFEITLPVLTPALLAVATLLFVEGLQNYDLPALLGAPAGIDTLSLRVADYVLKGSQPDWAAASALSMAVVAVIGALLVVQAKLLGGRSFNTVGGKGRAVPATRLRRWGWAVNLTIVLYTLPALLLPVAQIVVGSLQPYFGMFSSMSLTHYSALLADPEARSIMQYTFAIAVLGGLVTVACAFAIAHVSNRVPGTWLARLGQIASWMPSTAPGIVLSLALVWTYLNTPLVSKLYGSNWLLLAALVVSSMTLAVRAAEGMIAQIGPELEEAARLSGASGLRATMDTTMRLCTPSLLGAWLLVALYISGVLDVPLLLQSTQAQTVATHTYSLFSNGQTAEAAAFYCAYLGASALVISLIIAASAVLRRLYRRSHRIQTEGFAKCI